MGVERNLIIFDWDDTLFPTSWIFNLNIIIDNVINIKNYIVYFNELDNAVSKLLFESLKLGKVVIITNANINWINMTKYVLPKTSKLINEYIPIISARDEYSDVYPMSEWKLYAFNHSIYGFVSWASQIISFGDAEYEYNAMLSLKKYTFYGKKLKIIKFVQHPSFEKIIDQIELTTKVLGDIYNKKCHLDLKFYEK